MEKKLSKDAYGGIKGSQYKPYIGKENKNQEFTMQVLVIGILMAMLFSASNAYTAVTAGMTVAAGIPGAILGGGILTLVAKKNNILGNNLIQGMSSSGESIASGMTFVLPAVFIIGQDVNFITGVFVGIAGALLGIAITSLVHNHLIIEEHGKLIYPEAMAISETLVTTSNGGSGLKTMGAGFSVGGLFVLLSNQVTGLFSTTFSYIGEGDYKWQWQTDANPLLLGIGFIVGIEVAAMMFAGTILANFAIIPLIGFFAQNVDPTIPAWNDPELLISQMNALDIQNTYTKYIGSGMMLAGGLIGAIKLLPIIIKSIKETINGQEVDEDEMKNKKNITGVILVVGLLFLVMSTVFISSSAGMVIVSIVLIFLFSFLFSIVAARTTGDIGTSNLPVSGMTIASLLIITVIFLIIGNISGNKNWTNESGNLAIILALTTVVTAIATSGGYAQSQKTTFIVGGTKSTMQKVYTIAAVVGVIGSVSTIFLLKPLVLNTPGTAPQANLMASITEGILSSNLPWIIIGVGIAIAIVLYIMGLPIMTVALGFYLPIGTVSIIFVGAILKVLIQKITKDKEQLELKEAKGTIFSSGLIAGGAIIGLIGAILAVLAPNGDMSKYFFYFGEKNGESLFYSNGYSFLMIILLVTIVFMYINKKVKKGNDE